MLPKIFSFVGCPVIGQLGEESIVTYQNYCETCKRQNDVVQFLDYSFDRWDGEDIVKTGNIYAVTDRLRNALETSGLTGFSFHKMKTSKNELFEEIDPNNEIIIPTFWQLEISGKATGSSGWWEYQGECKDCYRPNWGYTDRVSRALMASVMGEIGPPRKVSIDSWQGESIFWLNDPGPPLVIDKVICLFNDLNITGVAFHPAEWETL
ncbi:hypothetical protein AFK68_25560 [Hydrocoleum sp. CS-953]|uniref:hypothetical protein n=1 Tax=Hydrocoleum sp. CS-953 TaxID=1671698 RepID=UPI000B9C6927|nr:hypothetical protein [Hydrocoleum sp. CS-953]OZH52259.1 hypothetical protein AFK68_25560 [Hydrocoleum sp. CS-953]